MKMFIESSIKRNEKYALETFETHKSQKIDNNKSSNSL